MLAGIISECREYLNSPKQFDVYSLTSVGFCRGSRVEGNMSRVEGRESRVEGNILKEVNNKILVILNKYIIVRAVYLLSTSRPYAFVGV